MFSAISLREDVALKNKYFLAILGSNLLLVFSLALFFQKRSGDFSILTVFLCENLPAVYVFHFSFSLLDFLDGSSLKD